MTRSNRGQTGAKAASNAGKVLASPKSTPAEKAAAASALSQAPSSKGQTGAKAASKAGKVLMDSSSTKAERSAAASTLAQTPSKKK
ncbi:hypothetical protein FHX81_2612 [Saccharothrix saharensis]|uniref:Uncharacterized protein n=1 Tax=Saccharothrix saharensis TaxID=571190 RepID=A0A543JBX4_9PSEU|nr:hypothetical protein [Saccharothrix saharensis]TQM80284.1 hypothetical protein FHX81_2612 [Saccharothrix saharensis]